jgi:hypothetical protein
MHLLNTDIGAWPNFFGLARWATLLREDCTVLVRTYEVGVYYQKLERIRSVVKHNPKWSDYVEQNIHAKRHMFANNLLKHYPCNLERQGNVPVDQNHASILQRFRSAL